MAKKIAKKTKKVIKDNMLLAVAITSVLVNMFFLIGVITYASTSKFDAAMLNRANERYCDDITDLDLAADDLLVNSKSVSAEDYFNVVCRSGDFAPYYLNAVNEYVQDLNY